MTLSPKKPLVSVVIPSGRAHRVSHTISCLLRQTLDKSQYEVLVVTPVPELIDSMVKPDVRIIGVEQLYPPGKMRNLGARQAMGKFLFFIDDDCLPPPEWLSSMLRALEHNETIGAVGCRVASSGVNFWCHCADYALFGAYQYDRKSQRDIGSAAMAVRRKAFEEAGGFEETLYASEDWDFNFRLDCNRWERVFDPSIKVVHNHGRGALGAILRQAFSSGFCSGLVVQKSHMDKISFLARLSVRMNSPWLYWLLIFPYALTVSILQVIEQKKTHPDFFLFIPVILMARCSYHLGVWRSLFYDRMVT